MQSVGDMPAMHLSEFGAEQTAIANYLDTGTARIDAIIAKTQTSIEKLKEYQAALISAAVTGKIDVRDEF